MRPPTPTHARRIVLNDETAWLWETKYRWSILQLPYQVDLENIDRDGKVWHTIDWRNYSPRKATFEGGLARYQDGHLDVSEFLQISADLVVALRRRDAPPSPPTKDLPQK